MAVEVELIGAVLCIPLVDICVGQRCGAADFIAFKGSSSWEAVIVLKSYTNLYREHMKGNSCCTNLWYFEHARLAKIMHRTHFNRKIFNQDRYAKIKQSPISINYSLSKADTILWGTSEVVFCSDWCKRGARKYTQIGWKELASVNINGGESYSKVAYISTHVRRQKKNKIKRTSDLTWMSLFLE